jgi:hypothetical protein
MPRQRQQKQRGGAATIRFSVSGSYSGGAAGGGRIVTVPNPISLEDLRGRISIGEKATPISTDGKLWLVASVTGKPHKSFSSELVSIMRRSQHAFMSDTYDWFVLTKDGLADGNSISEFRYIIEKPSRPEAVPIGEHLGGAAAGAGASVAAASVGASVAAAPSAANKATKEATVRGAKAAVARAAEALKAAITENREVVYALDEIQYQERQYAADLERHKEYLAAASERSARAYLFATSWGRDAQQWKNTISGKKTSDMVQYDPASTKAVDVEYFKSVSSYRQAEERIGEAERNLETAKVQISEAKQILARTKETIKQREAEKQQADKALEQAQLELDALEVYDLEKYTRVFNTDSTLVDLYQRAKASTASSRDRVRLWKQVRSQLNTIAERVAKENIPTIKMLLGTFTSPVKNPSPINQDKLESYLATKKLQLLDGKDIFEFPNGSDHMRAMLGYQDILSKINPKYHRELDEFFITLSPMTAINWITGTTLFTVDTDDEIILFPITGFHLANSPNLTVVFTQDGVLTDNNGTPLDTSKLQREIAEERDTPATTYRYAGFSMYKKFLELPNKYYLPFFLYHMKFQQEEEQQTAELEAAAAAKAEANRLAAEQAVAAAAAAAAAAAKAQANAAAAAAKAQANAALQQYKNDMNRISDYYKNYMDTTFGVRGADRYNHPGLNCRYGLEIEFLSSSNRYVLANRVNSCMFNQNFPYFWRRHVDPFTDDYTQIFRTEKMLKNDDSFDQYSTFFLEAQQEYRAPSYRGSAKCENRGFAGFRIEKDGSVENDWEKYRGITIWQSGQKSDLIVTLPNGQTNYTERFTGLYASHCDIYRTQSLPFLTEYRLKEGQIWNLVPPLTNDSVNFWSENEMVSPILFNQAVYYPDFQKYPEYDFQYPDQYPVEKMKILPLGALAVDNIVNHMIGHSNAIAMNGCGFHVHISEYPKITDITLRKKVITGFVKLFWFFEPLLYSFHPYYRAATTFAQSLQSLFTYNEIIEDNNWERLWKDLVSNTHYSGTDRKEKGDRYLAVNLQNCKPGKIGTVEVRIGHSTFCSVFIQSWITLLQNIFRLAQGLVMQTQGDPDLEPDPHYYINSILKKNQNCIPDYVKVSSEIYNLRTADPAKIGPLNQGRPLHGFFIHSGNLAEDKKGKTGVLGKLIGLLYLFTSSEGIIKSIFPFINYYHASTSSWNCAINIDPFDLDSILKQINEHFERPTTDDTKVKLTDTWNYFDTVILGYDYFINRGKPNVDHECTTCSKNAAGACKAEFNNYNIPALNDASRFPQNEIHQKNETVLLRDYCPQGPNKTDYEGELARGKHKGKTQTELINYKISPAHRQSGGRRSKTNQVNSSNTNQMPSSKNPMFEAYGNPIQNKTVLDTNPKYAEPNQPVYDLRKGADPIRILNTKNGIRAAYINWMGEDDIDDKLTNIFTALLTQKILSFKELLELIEQKYADPCIFTIDTPEHNAAVEDEVRQRFKMSNQKLDAIKRVYREFANSKEKIGNNQKQTKFIKQKLYTRVNKNSKKPIKNNTTKKVRNKVTAIQKQNSVFINQPRQMGVAF